MRNNLTPENCTHFLVDEYLDCSEKLLVRIGMQVGFESLRENDSKRKAKLTKIAEGLIDLAKEVLHE